MWVDIVLLLQRVLPITICAGSRLFAIMSATLGIEGGFRANVLQESAIFLERGRIHELLAGEELVHGDFACHTCCLSFVSG